ncbi:type II secretion system protein [Haloferula sp.]|uniref:type II secretion system protein n=1 Tax=Haloferula sp. TaxID=2497595 RepID=UPI0032A11A8B
MKRPITRRIRRGYTLVELSLAMSIGTMVAAMGLLLFNQQMAFLKIFKAQDFLTREAPMLNNYVVRVISAAEDYRLFEDIDSLKNGESPVLSGATVLVLRFREADGSMRASILSFEDPGTGLGLYYTMIPDSGIIGDPDWALSKQPSLVSFAVDQGVLRMIVSGPNGEELIYSGTQQL